MSTAQFYSWCMIGVVCIAPVGLYLCWLATINKRDYATVIDGVWDFARLVAALIGFILLGGVMLVALIQSDSRYLLAAEFDRLAVGLERQRWVWQLAATGYFVLVGLLIVSALRSRKNVWAIYNINLEQLNHAIENSLERLNCPDITRQGNQWQAQQPILKIIPFEATHHVLIQFFALPEAQQETLKRTLRDEIKTITPVDNDFARWATLLAGAVIIVILVLLGLGFYTVL